MEHKGRGRGRGRGGAGAGPSQQQLPRQPGPTQTPQQHGPPSQVQPAQVPQQMQPAPQVWAPRQPAPQRQPPAPQRQPPAPQRQPPAPQQAPSVPTAVRTPQPAAAEPPTQALAALRLSEHDTQIAAIVGGMKKGFPQRKGFGTQGRPIDLFANHFEMSVPSGEVYHYDVEIMSQNKTTAAVPDQKKYRCLSTKINRMVIEALARKYKRDLQNCIPAFDGRKNLYTRRPLPFKERTFTVGLPEEDRKEESIFFVKIQYAADVNLDALHAVYAGRASVVPQEVLQALDIIVRNGSCIQMTPVGRSIFKPNRGGDYSLGGGKEVWFGYYTSVRPAQWKPMLNIDRSATAFYEHISVLEFMCKLFGDQRRQLRPEDFRELNAHQVQRLNKELKGLKVYVNHLPYKRKYRVVKVTLEPARRITFPLDNGTRCSVADYFRTKYPQFARFPNLPCIQSGTPAKPVHLPLEVCTIVEGQHCKKKLSDVQTSNMIKQTAMPPAKRFESIKGSIREVISTNKEYLDEFGIKISTDPTRLKGRVLKPPTLVFKDDSMLSPREGQWDLRGSLFLKGASVQHWVLLNISRYVQKNDVDRFIGMLLKGAKSLGMHMDPPADVRAEDPDRRPMRDILGQIKRGLPNVELVVIILAKNSNYPEIKQVSETELGLRTQCILDNSVQRKCNDALITNLCLKINTKTGGVNNGLLSKEKPEMFKRPVIIMGADVTHPAPGDKVRPSIAACVGSLDSIPSRYHAVVRVQMEDSQATARVEIIQDLTNIVVELLKAFYRETHGKKPERIIFYRDGVSEGQFEEVRNKEVAAIRLACKLLSPNETYEPPITFIVVQKRHHTRFMPVNERDGVGRPRNIPPGTTVDTVITHPVDFDFFLCSHTGIQGTSKPSHYYVVWDDSDYSADELQKLSYYLCHTYARCARSVSIPAPVYYAHLAAFRAKNHIVSKVDISSSASESSGGSGDKIETEQYVKAVNVLPNFHNQMYYV
ncbi:protein argonaute-2-like isoform X2 [Ornithodoros turicata]|uniref:protein argonaute-2-like isoform X2 n=1 Tax=Ornithodoros turicata TaxID=34597 RepID=UPI00313A21E3